MNKNQKKKLGALITAVVICAFLAFILAFIFFAVLNFKEARFLLIYGAVIACMIVGTVIALVLRFKEINSGEEDEAGKY